ncbi:MAG TPA: pyridoxamine 5'-phosphate oxidase family protein [Candidatus Sulfotelmatobacter sp.]|nr:pyridoxamine 5'-phosphate oxidase family protein [Candidatus Sulfotelmatobacter sp.]
MPKTKGKKSSALRQTDPTNFTVGLPQVPAMYGMKTPHKFLPFSHAEERLERSRSYWVCTARPDGRPHSIPVWGFWLDGTLYFGTGRTSRKAQNLAHNPALSIHLESGDDVVILEGKAVEVDLNDKELLKRLDAASREKYKMPMMVIPETMLFSVRPRLLLAWTEKDYPNNATRWQFDR